MQSSLPNQPFEFIAVTLKSQGIKAVHVFILLLFMVKDFCLVGDMFNQYLADFACGCSWTSFWRVRISRQ
jgi:hypothetical protein